MSLHQTIKQFQLTGNVASDFALANPMLGRFFRRILDCVFLAPSVHLRIATSALGSNLILQMQDDDSSDEQTWEERARDAIAAAAGLIDFDDVRGVALVCGEECRNAEQVRQALESIGEEQWINEAPADLNPSVEDYVNDAISESNLEIFFDLLKPQDHQKELGSAADLILPSGSHVLRVDLETVNSELAKYLARHPEKLYDLSPRKFEELIAELFKDMGYNVELGPGTKDGGVDVRAISKSAVGTALTLVQCKKNRPSNPVGVEIVNRLYGIVERERATQGLVVTTSFFTKGAKAERDKLQFRLELADYDRVVEFLSQYPRRKK